jgi:hypothetical protein
MVSGVRTWMRDPLSARAAARVDAPSSPIAFEGIPKTVNTVLHRTALDSSSAPWSEKTRVGGVRLGCRVGCENVHGDETEGERERGREGERGRWCARLLSFSLSLSLCACVCVCVCVCGGGGGGARTRNCIVTEFHGFEPVVLR